MKTKNAQKPLIILTAGGTGGHVYPAEALAEELSERGYRLMLVTDKRGLNNYKGKLGEIPNYAVFAGAVMGKSYFFKLQSLCKTAIGILQCIRIILKNRPACVVGFGGYASFPCAMAALLLGTDLVIHEQNSVMSRTNRFLARYASLVAASFKNTKFAPDNGKTVVTGMPIRHSICELLGEERRAPAASGKFKILVLGGSQGAKVFSEVVPAAVAKLPLTLQKRLEITAQCRKDEVAEVTAKYKELPCQTEVAAFFNDMPERYRKNDLIISRSGASSVFEIAAACIPSILVPLPTAADDHQTGNAAEFKRTKAGIVIAQSDFTPQKLAIFLTELMEDSEYLKKMGAATRRLAIANAATRFANQLEKKIIQNL